MNPLIIELWNYLKTIPVAAYLFVFAFTFIVFHLLSSYYRPSRFQLTAATFSLLWLIRFIGNFEYHELILSKNSTPFTHILFPVCFFVYFSFMLYEKKEALSTVKKSAIIAIWVFVISVLLF
jgi:hypothetical protein